MNESPPKSNLAVIQGKSKRKLRGEPCKSCGKMSPMKGSDYCFRCNPEYNQYALPRFSQLTTLEGIRRAYGNLLNGVRKGKIDKSEASTLFYGLNGFVKSMKLLLDMKIELEKDKDKPIVSDAKIEELKGLIIKLETLNKKFTSNTRPEQTGEIAQEKEE